MSNLEIKKEREGGGKKKNIFLTRAYQAMNAGMAILALTGPIKDAEKIKNNPAEKTSSASSDGMGIRPPSWLMTDMTSKEKVLHGDWKNPEFRRVPFFEGLDENGNPRFNAWSLVAMFQAEIPYLDKVEGKVTIRMPFEYARLFAEDRKADHPLNPGDHLKIEKFLDNEFNKRFEEILCGWDWSKRVYKHSQKDPPENLRIRSIEITGTASPEGPRSKGPETIRPGAVDEDNLALAQRRGKVGLSLAKEWLEKSGINLRQIEEKISKINAAEIQLNEREMAALKRISQKMEGSDDMERIYNLIKAYNDKRIGDGDIIDILDQAIGKKRMVEVSINYEGEKRRRVLIPIPLLPIIFGIALPGLVRAVKKRNETKQKVLEISSTVEKTDLPPENSVEYQNMWKKTLIDDLGLFFDNKEAVGRGLNYRILADDAKKHLGDFRDENERELYLTDKILEAWKSHDKKCRQEAGFSPTDLESGLDYENQPYQIKWAKMHARALLNLVYESQKNEDDYKHILSRKISKILDESEGSQG